MRGRDGGGIGKYGLHWAYLVGCMMTTASPGESCAMNSVKCPAMVVPLEVMRPVPVNSCIGSVGSSGAETETLSSRFLFALKRER
jgi:hypothetical protein